MSKKKALPSLDSFLVPIAGGSDSWADAADDDGAGMIERSPSPEPPARSPSPPPFVLQLPDRPPFTLFVGNLPFSARDQDIKAFFAPTPVQEVRFVIDRTSNKNKGICYVDFPDQASMAAALKLNCREMNGRSVKIDLSVSQRGGGSGAGGGGGRGHGGGSWGGGAGADRFQDRGGDRYQDRGGGNDRHRDRNGGGYIDRHQQQLGRSAAPAAERPELRPAVVSKAPVVPAPVPAIRTKMPLLPRSAAAPASTAPTAKSNPFGAARPREEVLSQRQVERPAAPAVVPVVAAAKPAPVVAVAKSAPVAAVANPAPVVTTANPAPVVVTAKSPARILTHPFLVVSDVRNGVSNDDAAAKLEPAREPSTVAAGPPQSGKPRKHNGARQNASPSAALATDKSNEDLVKRQDGKERPQSASGRSSGPVTPSGGGDSAAVLQQQESRRGGGGQRGRGGGQARLFTSALGAMGQGNTGRSVRPESSPLASPKSVADSNEEEFKEFTSVKSREHRGSGQRGARRGNAQRDDNRTKPAQAADIQARPARIAKQQPQSKQRKPVEEVSRSANMFGLLGNSDDAE